MTKAENPAQERKSDQVIKEIIEEEAYQVILAEAAQVLYSYFLEVHSSQAAVVGKERMNENE